MQLYARRWIGPAEKERPIAAQSSKDDPSSVQNTASYAFNDYFLKHRLTGESCNFDNNVAVTSLNPSHGNCKFPSSLTVSNNGSFSGSTPSSSVGLGPSEDISGCSKAGWTWFWPLIASHLLLMLFQDSKTVESKFSL